MKPLGPVVRFRGDERKNRVGVVNMQRAFTGQSMQFCLASLELCSPVIG